MELDLDYKGVRQKNKGSQITVEQFKSGASIFKEDL
jgi:hypothetical protein